VILLQRLGDGIENGINGTSSIGFGKTRIFRNFSHQIILIHGNPLSGDELNTQQYATKGGF
jgi:hypothetical protein